MNGRASTPADTTRNERAAVFATTRWSVVARAGEGSDTEARRAALSELCEAYWYPVYAFARRRGNGVDDAADLVQGFFTRLIEKHDLARADAERGRFRSFLLSAFVHYATNEWDRSKAAKRGGGRTGFSLDQARAEGRFTEEPADEDDPELLFLRTWARTLLEGVVEELRKEYEAGDKGVLFARLRPALMGEPEAEGFRAVAEEMETTEGAVKVAAHRMRKRFGTLLRREIAATLRDPEDPEAVQAEIQALFEALR